MKQEDKIDLDKIKKIEELFEGVQIRTTIKNIHQWVNYFIKQTTGENKEIPDEEAVDFYEKGEDYLLKLREQITGIPVNYLIADTREDKINENGIAPFLKEIKNLHLIKGLKDVPKSKELKINTQVKSLKEDLLDYEKKKNNLVDLLRIRNRLNQVQKYYQDSTKEEVYTTYYGTKDTINQIALQSYTPEPIVQQSISDRFKLWTHFLNTSTRGKGYPGKTYYDNKEQTTRTIIDSNSYTLYAKARGKIGSIGINGGQLLEAFLLASSLISPNNKKAEYIQTLEQIKNKDFSRDVFFNLKQEIETQLANSIDYVMITATIGMTELFRGGDVNFELYQINKKTGDIETYVRSFQVKGRSASVSKATIENGLILFDNFFYNSSRTNPIRDRVNRQNNINNVKTLKDLFWEETTDLSPFSDKVAQKILNKISLLELIKK